MNRMIRRQQAAQASIDAFGGKPLAWGSRDCAKLVRFHLHKLGVPVSFLKGRQWRSERGALRVFRDLGFETLADGVDALGFPRIAPASAWVGDIVALPAAAPFGASLMIAVGNGRLLGMTEGRFVILEPAEYLAAWRIPDDG